MGHTDHYPNSLCVRYPCCGLPLISSGQPLEFPVLVDPPEYLIRARKGSHAGETQGFLRTLVLKGNQLSGVVTTTPGTALEYGSRVRDSLTHGHLPFR